MVGKVLRGDNEHVGFAELFYDLVFVFAITQVSHGFLKQIDLAGAGQTLFLFMAVWWVWIYTTWVLNRLDPERIEVRVLLFALMGAGLFLSMSLPEAFGERGMVFAVSYCTMQIGRSLFMLWSSKENATLRRTFLRIMIWFMVSGVFWIAGAMAQDQTRVLLWVIALGIEYAGPAAGFWVPGSGRDTSADWEVKGGHMAERCGLFVIICLGETLLVSGATFAEMEWTLDPTLSFLGAFAGTIGMWWVYFHIGHRRGSYQIEHSADPGKLARLAFTYLHIPIVAGVVLAAVGSELAIAHPHGHAGWPEITTIIGGVALFLFGNGLFKRVSANNFPLSHSVGIALCLGVALTSHWMILWQINALAAIILAVVALWEQRSVGGALAAHSH
jgi:low temperature requirement protein LtrA